MMGYDGARVKSVDVDPYENCDLIHDFNSPIPVDWKGAYDLIVDFGTIEHFSMFGRLFRTKLMWAERFYILPPGNMMNHGLYNVTAGLLRDVYTANGFELIEADFIASDLLTPGEYRVISDEDLPEIDGVPGHYLAARGVYRKVERVPFSVPKQGLYRSLHQAWERTTRNFDAPQVEVASPSAKRSWIRSFTGNKSSLPGRIVKYAVPKAVGRN